MTEFLTHMPANTLIFITMAVDHPSRILGSPVLAAVRRQRAADPPAKARGSVASDNHSHNCSN